jgi:4,5-DOPA dioxygenase extradiol
MLPLESGPATAFLRRLGKDLEAKWGRPKAVLCASAHWASAVPCLSLADRPETIHDFYGFPESLYRLTYPAPGAPEMARHAAACLEAAGVTVGFDAHRGLDHGAWMPFHMMWPEADIPVAQIAIQPALGSAHHIALGRALAPLRAENVLIVGSGGAVHNLHDLAFRRQAGDETTPDWAEDFSSWLEAAVAGGDETALADYRNCAPGARLAHPTDEHLMPLHFAFGAGGATPGRPLFHGYSGGSLSMAAFAFAA